MAIAALLSREGSLVFGYTAESALEAEGGAMDLEEQD
jgi:hypothetical protein